MAKHIVNKSEDWARQSLEGYLYANNNDLIALEEFPNVIVRKDYMSLAQSNKVALLAGGGSGHEPAHIGFIGNGMLTGAVCGHLFASPSTAAILAAIRFVGYENKAGVLLIVKNYTGDRLNFGLAAKRAQHEGINVDWILVDDDIALVDKESKEENVVGKRGLCGTILIEKIAGALAEQKKSIKEIKAFLQFILEGNYLRTLGISLSGRVILPDETLKKNQEESSLIDIGLGIHGEAGKRKIEMISSQELAKLTLNDYLFDPSFEINSVNDVCLMINNLGGLSTLELYVFANDCIKFIQKNKPYLKVRRIYCGTFMTSLNMNGFSVSAIYLEKTHSNSILDLLDAQTTAPSWPKTYGENVSNVFKYTSSSYVKASILDSKVIDNEKYVKLSNNTMLEFFFKKICQDLISIKDYLNELDTICGDGDCGSSLANISEIILKDIENKKFKFEYPHQVFLHCSSILEDGGGSLCILLALFFSAGAQAFFKDINDVSNEQKPIYWFKIWSKFLELGISAVQEYGRAKPNQRSIVDPLTSIYSYFQTNLDSNEIDTESFLKKLVDVTNESVQSTSKMIPKVGRASYVDPNLIKKPDAGASGIYSIIGSINKAYSVFNQK